MGAGFLSFHDGRKPAIEWQMERFEGLDSEAKEDLLCELNVLDEARLVEETSIVRNAWKRGQNLEIHGWIYWLSDGLLRALNFKPQSRQS
jgi:carbonic anhydrase